MGIYYLIDYENVRENGISSLPPTENTDHIYVFYTDNASKLNMDAMLGHEAELKFIKVAAGKQSLDMHLVSVLGFLLRDQGGENSYIVVSRDNGFDNVINFWKSKGFQVGRHTANAPVPEAEERQDKPEEKKKSKKTRKNASDKKKSNKKEKSLSEEAVMEEVPADEEVSRDVIIEASVEVPVKRDEETAEASAVVPAVETVAEVVVTNETAVEEAAEELSEETEATQAVESSVSEESAASEETTEKPADVPAEETKEAEDIPEVSSEVDGKETAIPEKEAKREMDSHTLMNNKIMSLLRGKIDANTLGAIASIVIRNMDVKNYKQVTYRAMVKKFGQKQGLEYYNMIKKEI